MLLIIDKFDYLKLVASENDHISGRILISKLLSQLNIDKLQSSERNVEMETYVISYYLL